MRSAEGESLSDVEILKEFKEAFTTGDHGNIYIDIGEKRGSIMGFARVKNVSTQALDEAP